MADISDRVAGHYRRDGILDAIDRALTQSGRDPARIDPADLAPVDEFHIGGRETTMALAQLAQLQPGMRVLDVGCGLGGSARLLASRFGCEVMGIDLTQDYVDAATALSARLGLSKCVRFMQASAHCLPLADAVVDIVWTEHVQMNVADKVAFYGELARVLRPGGRLVLHEVFQGSGGPARYPVPWADDASISFLVAPESAQQAIKQADCVVVNWIDTSAHSVEWLRLACAKQSRKVRVGANLAGPALGLHLLLGADARLKLENMARNLSEGRTVVVQAVVSKR